VADKRNGLCSANDNQSHGGEFMDGGYEHARDGESAIGGHESDFRRGEVLPAEAAMRAQLKTFGSGGESRPLSHGFQRLDCDATAFGAFRALHPISFDQTSTPSRGLLFVPA
jgi:hypothetical protein